MKQLGLIGFPLSHSFSQKYFTEKFKILNLDNWKYDLFPLENLNNFHEFIDLNPNLVGLNVTIPYKTDVIKYLDEIDEKAKTVGAVNTIKISILPNGKKWLKGYNTDVYGFGMSLIPLLKKHHKKNAIILGTGGGAKAVKYVLDRLNIQSIHVSRNPEKNQISYMQVDEKMLQEYLLIVNCTPLGMFPAIDNLPPIPYQYLTKNHLLYDLIYNPEETAFLKMGEAKGAETKNGLQMLYLQAEKAWEIFSKEL